MDYESSVRRRLRTLIAAPEILVLPGIYDALSAKIAVSNGFDAILAGGNAACGVLLGQPDLGQLGFRDYLDHYGRIAAAVDVPLLVDADNGFGGVHNVQRMVRGFERAGIAGFLMEDQIFPKRAGRAIIAMEEMQNKIKAAADVRQDADFLICARTDIFKSEGLTAAIDRAQAYYEAGADVTFVQGAIKVEDLQAICTKVSCSQLASIAPGLSGNNTSIFDVEKAGIAAVFYSTTTMLAAAFAVDNVLASLKSNGNLRGVAETLIGSTRYNEIVDLQARQRIDKKYNGQVE